MHLDKRRFQIAAFEAEERRFLALSSVAGIDREGRVWTALRGQGFG